jgi:hypothetical protein
MSEVEPFERRTLAWLAGLGAGSLLLGLYLTFAVSPGAEVESVRADTFSRSALGHRAFVDLLRELKVPLVVSRHNSGGRAAGSAVLTLLEPDAASPADQHKLSQMIEHVHTVLLVLPKWTGPEDREKPGWLKAASLVPESEPAALLHLAGITGRVRRSNDAGPARCGQRQVELHSPQLVEAAGLESIVSCEGGGILLGARTSGDRRVVVLADPDIIANHGLGRAENAALALHAIGAAGSPAKTLVIDETLHGHEAAPSLWRELFHFPLVLALLQGVLAVGVLVAAGMLRFGAPLLDGPAIEPGKGVLIDNTASLLGVGGHAAVVLERYLERTLHEVREARGAGERGGSGDRRTRPRSATGVDIRVVESQVQRIRGGAAAGDSVIVSLAQKIHRWKEEVIRGSHARS